MGIIERKERDKQEMRKLILDTAMNLFLEEGFQNVSIRKIADKMEYSPATLYLYFKERDEILFALHNEGFEELFRRQQELLTIADPARRLRRHGEIYIRFAFEHPEYYNLMFIMRGPVKKIVEGEEWLVGMRSYEFFRNDVQTAINAGLLAGSDVDLATFSLWSLAHGIVALILRNRCTMLDQKELPAAAMAAYNLMMDQLSVTA
jgi:AcrR family transcriptional regulator